MAALLNRQKPIAASGSAWWPGGRTSTNALSRPPGHTASTASTAAPGRQRGRVPASRRHGPCRRPGARAAQRGPQRCAVVGMVDGVDLLVGGRARGCEVTPGSARPSRSARIASQAFRRLRVALPRIVVEKPSVGEDQRAHGDVLLPGAGRYGSSNENTLPPPGASRTATSLPWSRTISRTNASPRPVPFSRVVKNGVKIFSRRSAGPRGRRRRTSTCHAVPVAARRQHRTWPAAGGGDGVAHQVEQRAAQLAASARTVRSAAASTVIAAPIGRLASARGCRRAACRSRHRLSRGAGRRAYSRNSFTTILR